jgi:dihydroxyacid dehydratase/phosphogluconate dehydratase
MCAGFPIASVLSTAQQWAGRCARHAGMGPARAEEVARRGVRDMVRISDARMSGTHYGCCVVHAAPEAAVGGPLALVRTGDRIQLDVDAGTLDMLVDAEELERRRAAWRPPVSPYQRSYAALYQAHVGQAPEGCDFDFLTGRAPTPEPPSF